MSEASVKYQITEEYVGERLDKGLSLLIDYVSRSSLAKKIKDGNVLVNGRVVKPSYLLCENDEVELTVSPSEEPEILAEAIPLDILYEDNDVLVVNKPKDMVVHPAPGHYSHTLVNAVMHHCKDSLSGINGVLRPGIVHRIDKDTTGSIIICKNDRAHLSIANQLKEHSIKREYHAICYGRIEEPGGVIQGNIGRDPKDRMKMAIVPSGKPAITHYEVLKRFEHYTYIKCILETGRTHQIRVHMASIHHPLLGDSVYAGEPSKFKLNGQTLHAKTIGFVHPVSGQYIELDAPLPDYFEHLLSILE